MTKSSVLKKPVPVKGVVSFVIYYNNVIFIIMCITRSLQYKVNYSV